MQNTKLSQSIVRQTNDDNNNDNEVYSYVDSMTPLWKKYPDIHGYFVANFPHFNVTGSVYVCIRKSTDLHIAMWDARASLFRRFTDTNVYGTAVPLKCIWKTRRKISVDIRIFFTVYAVSHDCVDWRCSWTSEDDDGQDGGGGEGT